MLNTSCQRNVAKLNRTCCYLKWNGWSNHSVYLSHLLCYAWGKWYYFIYLLMMLSYPLIVRLIRCQADKFHRYLLACIPTPYLHDPVVITIDYLPTLDTLPRKLWYDGRTSSNSAQKTTEKRSKRAKKLSVHIFFSLPALRPATEWTKAENQEEKKYKKNIRHNYPVQ